MHPLSWFSLTGWFFVGILVTLLYLYQQRSLRKRLNLTSYIIILLLNDEFRNEQRTTFENGLRMSEEKVEPLLVYSAHDTVEAVADGWAKGTKGVSSVSVAYSLVTRLKKGDQSS